jgi:E3 ubiquitin-protein ligase CCNP1IP1
MVVSSFWFITVPHPGNMQPVFPLIDASACRLVDAMPSALSFWQYQIHQENSYQQSVLKYANEKNGQLQKQLDNVIREGT